MFKKYMEYMAAIPILLLIISYSLIVLIELLPIVGKFWAVVISILTFVLYSFLIFPNWIRGSK